jgi:hypothetical protein
VFDPAHRSALLGDWPLFAPATEHEAAEAALVAAGLDDGLPMVPPTPGRLAAMLAGAAEPGRSLGHLPPLLGEATPARLAYLAVLAGCPPGALSVLVAAAEALQADELNLLGVTTTTGSAALALLVHGPVAGELGLEAGIDCLSATAKANAGLGRALALVVRNIAGARAGVGDMATVGQPAKRGLAFAEAVTAPFASLGRRRGLAAGESGVTLLALSGTLEVLPEEERAAPEAVLAPMARAMATAVATNGAARRPDPPEQVFLLPPELAEALARAGWTLEAIGAFLIAEGARAGSRIAAVPGDVHPIVTGGAGVKMAYLPPWGGGARMVTRSLTRSASVARAPASGVAP